MRRAIVATVAASSVVFCVAAPAFAAPAVGVPVLAPVVLVAPTPTPSSVPEEGPPQLPAGLSTGQCVPGSPTISRPVPWAQKLLGPQRAYPLTAGGGVTVAVVDSGVSALAPALAGAVLPGLDVRAPGQPGNIDCAGHGTFVAGIIAARPARRVGFIGVAPRTKILPVRVTDTSGKVNTGVLARGIRAAAEAGAKVINVSVSTPFPSAELEAAVALAEARDAVVVAAASNRAEEGNPRSYPAAYPSVVAVGAIGADGSRGSFSGAGEFVDLAAPGVDVVSISPRGGGHYVGTGTSFAAPFVSAAAALVRSYHPKLSAAQVRARLEATATRPAAPVPDPEVGHGVVNPYDAVTSLLSKQTPGASPSAQAVRLPPPATDAGAPAVSMAAMATAGGATVAVAVTLLVLGTLVRGRRRRWSPPQPNSPQ